MKVTLEDALSLLSKYVEERTPVRAVLGTPSVSIARVVGTIRVSIVRAVPHLLIGKEDTSESAESLCDSFAGRQSTSLFSAGQRYLSRYLSRDSHA
jgi:hypothetical protein